MSGEDSPGKFTPGMTFKALVASLLCITLAAIYTNYSSVVLKESRHIAESAIPVPAIVVVLGLTLFVGAVSAIFRFRLLSKAEIVCVTFATMMAVPLMTEGFWHRLLALVAIAPRTEAYDYSDALDDRLWPHGRNLLEGAFAGHDDTSVMRTRPATASSGKVWCAIAETDGGVMGPVLAISNSAPDEVSYVDFAFHIDPDDPRSMRPGEPHLFSVLTRADKTEASTELFALAFADENPISETLFSGSPVSSPSYLHKTGFGRHGKYGAVPSRTCLSNLVVRIGLSGRGFVEVADPRFYSVAALEGVYRGRKIVDEAEWNAMAPEDRPVGAVVRPAKKWSLAMLAFYLRGLIPVREWVRPVLIWGSYVAILLTALFCVNVIMRRKWAESERYPMPNTRIPLAIAGAGPGDDLPSPFAAIWRNRWAWAGLIFALIYGLLKGAHFYNPRIPNVSVILGLGETFTNPGLGKLFDCWFVLSLLVCSIAVFFELNVLLSLVVGYWLCRTQYCIGHLAGIDVNSGFPWFQEQAAGAYIGYFAIVVILSAKYIWGVLKDAFRGAPGDEADVMTPRAAVVLFVLCHIAVAAWSGLAGASALAMSVTFSFLVLFGFVAAKYRAECGSPFGYFVPQNVMLLVGILGGMRVFGVRGMFVSLLLSGFLTTTVFYLIPGMQFEMIEVGRRLRIKPRHIAYTCLVGLLGGLVIGGWAFLSSGYTAGADSLRGASYYNGLAWFVTRIRAPLTQATLQWQNDAAGVGASVANWGGRAMVFSGVMMAVLTLLRQYFAGFWFHPVGLMLGFTSMNDGANWGTILLAWLIRLVVLKIGGARAVRTKLLPFFAGSFIGCVIAIVVMTVVNGNAVSTGIPNFYDLIP